MKSSIQIQNEIHACDQEIDKLSGDFNAAEGDAQAAIHDQICELRGKKGALYDQLSDAQAAEDAIRRDGGVPLAAGTPEPKAAKHRTLGEELLGARDTFNGLAFGQKLSVNVMDASDKPYTNFGLPGQTEIDYDLPRQTSDNAYQFGFLDSLPKGTTAADILTYFAKDDSKYENNASAWSAGEEKPSSKMGWKQDSCQVETIAHLMPVLEQQVKDWGQLRSLIDVELLMGLRIAEAKAALVGANSNGITGVLKNTGIQAYTAAKNDDLVDSVRKMKTDILLKSGFQPTHLAAHPYVTESLELMKDKNGRYIQQVINGKLWALTVVEDVNLTGKKTVTSANDTDTYGALVYWNQAAMWFTKETDSIQVGLVGNQFSYNEATIRAEGRHALKVTYPKAFSYLADTGVAGR